MISKSISKYGLTVFWQKAGPGASVNEELAEELQEKVIKKFKRTITYARFKENIWSVDLAEMGSLSSRNRSVKYLYIR